jgi:ribonucleoside-diphosphate reductase alpha chain
LTGFKTEFSERIFRNKYAQGTSDTWDALAHRLVEDVCGSRWGTQHPLLSKSDRDQLEDYIRRMLFIPGGRYLYYAGRAFKAYNNCYLLRCEEDTREEWGRVLNRASDCLMAGGGIGNNYSILRGYGELLTRTGGISSGPLPLMHSVNEVGRNAMQGGSRRSAIYASLDSTHPDINLFLHAKDWKHHQIGKAVKQDGTPYTHWDAKQENFNHAAPLDMTNISVNYRNVDIEAYQIGNDGLWTWDSSKLLQSEVFMENCRQAMSSGEPGFSFNFFEKDNETLRNACTEVTSEDDS